MRYYGRKNVCMCGCLFLCMCRRSGEGYAPNNWKWSVSFLLMGVRRASKRCVCAMEEKILKRSLVADDEFRGVAMCEPISKSKHWI